MTPIKRFEALFDGKKIRMIRWDKYKYIYHDGHYIRERSCVHYERLYTLFNPDEKWELYEEPENLILLTPEDVGRRVRLKNGDVRIILAYLANKELWVISSVFSHRVACDKRGVSSEGPDDCDVYEVYRS